MLNNNYIKCVYIQIFIKSEAFFYNLGLYVHLNVTVSSIQQCMLELSYHFQTLVMIPVPITYDIPESLYIHKKIFIWFLEQWFLEQQGMYIILSEESL